MLTRIRRPRLITALTIFFMMGAAISLTASLSLLSPNSFLAPMWRLNPRAHENLSGLGFWAVALLGSVSLFCAAAAIGLWQESRWGYRIAIGVMVVNLIGDQRAGQVIFRLTTSLSKESS